MQRIFFVLTLSLLLSASVYVPANVLAARAPATFSAARSVLAASSSPGNAYVAGASIVLTAPVAGDSLLLAGSIRSRARVAGDLRAIGGSITVEEPVMGDLAAFGFSVHEDGRTSGNVFLVAMNVSVTNGASGPVSIYGNTVSLAGDFAGDVHVVSSGRLTLAESTIIRGTLFYEAPDMATIPASATLMGGIQYINASYLPDAGTSRILSLVSIGFFLFVRILGALILAGLLAGLFPRLAEIVVECASRMRPRAILLTMLLGFAILVATPVLLLLLTLTFVGIGLALLLCILYALVAFLALLYAGILLGSVIVRRYAKRETVLWHDGVLGMLVLSLIALVPIVGIAIILLLTVFSAGVLLQIFFHFAFPREGQTPEML